MENLTTWMRLPVSDAPHNCLDGYKQQRRRKGGREVEHRTELEHTRVLGREKVRDIQSGREARRDGSLATALRGRLAQERRLLASRGWDAVSLLVRPGAISYLYPTVIKQKRLCVCGGRTRGT